MVKEKKKERAKKGEVSKETLLVAAIAMLSVVVMCFGSGILYLDLANTQSIASRSSSKSTEEKTIPVDRGIVNYLDSVSKLNESLDIVYDAEETETNRYPFININNEDVEMINSEIKDLATNKIKAGSSITYEYGTYDKYLSVSLVENNGVCVRVFKTYLIDLTTNELVNGEEIINELDDNSKYELFLRVRDIVGSEFENELRQDDSHDVLRNATLENIYRYNLSASDGDLYIVVNIESSNTCSKSLRISLTNFTYSYFVM